MDIVTEQQSRPRNPPNRWKPSRRRTESPQFSSPLPQEASVRAPLPPPPLPNFWCRGGRRYSRREFWVRLGLGLGLGLRWRTCRWLWRRIRRTTLWILLSENIAASWRQGAKSWHVLAAEIVYGKVLDMRADAGDLYGWELDDWG